MTRWERLASEAFIFAGLRMTSAPDILCVDDSTVDAMVLQLFAKRTGYSVQSSNSAESGLLAALSELPKLIVADLHMPGMDGIEFVKALKGNETTRHIPVLMISSDDNKALINAAMSAGIDDFITKPLELSKMQDYFLYYLGVRNPLNR